MSTGDDHRYGVPPLPDDYGGTGQTRTRLPDRAGPPRRPGPRRPSRGLVVIGAVVALLIAAIAFANQNTDDSPSHPDTTTPAKAPAPAPTTPTGTKPTQTPSQSGVPAGYPHTKEGAQSAAANYTVALGSDGMFDKDRRPEILTAVYTSQVAAQRTARLDKVYSDKDFLARIGLAPDGSAPDGLTFISRSSPLGTKAESYSDTKASVAVWYSTLFGFAGESTQHPVTESWYTTTFELTWTGQDWKVDDDKQEEGPTPVNGDQRVSSSEDMQKAVEQFGGFTYAR
ncbi:hypothetical protein [Streptomyces sp. SA3_actF]|nr:hypothetical protein [Streptomyces sp. SA3_actF]